MLIMVMMELCVDDGNDEECVDDGNDVVVVS